MTHFEKAITQYLQAQ